jgi:predicted SnoaL-like aldol condensation-catalyzing enzyme
MMASEMHKTIIHRLVEEVFNQGDLAAVDTVYAPVFTLNDLPTRVNDFKQAITMLHATFPGFHITTGDLVAIEDIVAATWTIHTRPSPLELYEALATREAAWTGLHVFRITEGKIVEEWLNWDALQQLQHFDPLFMPQLPAGYHFN